VAVTHERELLLVDQFRPPIRGRVIELPAGLVGDVPEFQDESIAEAAVRELREEVGYEAREIRLLTEGCSSPGLTDERVKLVMALNLNRVGDGGGDSQEDIIVHHVPLETVDRWLADQIARGKEVDFKVYAGLYFVRQALFVVR
jgi:ADP-ribose pyrophosphatase